MHVQGRLLIQKEYFGQTEEELLMSIYTILAGIRTVWGLVGALFRSSDAGQAGSEEVKG